MNQVQNIPIILTFGGALILLLAIHKSQSIFNKVPLELKKKWSLLIALIWIFVPCYVLFILLLSFDLRLPLELLAGFTFLGGALFVYGMIIVSRRTIKELYNMRNLQEELVIERTRELNNTSKSLLNTREEMQIQKDFLEKVIDSLSHPFYVIDVSDFSVVMSNSASAFPPRSST